MRKKVQEKPEKARVFEMYKHEWDTFEKSLEVSEDLHITTEDLKIEYIHLSKKFKKLLKETMKLTRIGDVNYKKMMEANDQVRKQKSELETLNRELREANAVKDKFYSIIAHDLRNPLQFLLLSTGLLDSDFASMDAEVIKFYIEKIFNTAKNMSELLENLLEWSQSQYGKIQCHPKKLDIFSLARENTKLYRENAEKKDLFLEVDVPEGSFVYADENMINSVLRNLVNNAIKFTPAGGSIRVSVVDEGESLLTSVFNSGTALSEERIQQFFKIGENYTTMGTANEKGSGLGLVLCKEFVEKNRGEITVRSKDGEGNFFEFSLPKTEHR